MIKPFEFYFDFGSPYSVLAHKKIREIEKENSIKIKYMPIFLGGIFKLAGNNELNDGENDKILLIRKLMILMNQKNV